VGGDFSPQDVVRLLQRIVARTGATAVEYHDERGPRCVTSQVRDERYHVPFTVQRAGRCWRIDLTLWLHDPHVDVTRWHEELRERITADSVPRCCASKMCGTGGPNIPIRSVAWTSIPPWSMMACAPRASSPPGLPAAGCPPHSAIRPARPAADPDVGRASPGYPARKALHTGGRCGQRTSVYWL